MKTIVLSVLIILSSACKPVASQRQGDSGRNSKSSSSSQKAAEGKQELNQPLQNFMSSVDNIDRSKAGYSEQVTALLLSSQVVLAESSTQGALKGTCLAFTSDGSDVVGVNKGDIATSPRRSLLYSVSSSLSSLQCHSFFKEAKLQAKSPLLVSFFANP